MLSEYGAGQEAREFANRVHAAAVPHTFTKSDFSSWRAPTESARMICTVLENYCADFARQREVRTGFLFTGPPGTGKTHLACAMVYALLAKGFSARYLSLPAFTRNLRATYSRQGATESLVQGLIGSDFLVLDELDLHGTSDTDYNTLYDIVNSRYERGLAPILGISNRSLDRLTVDLDERIVSRILGPTKPIIFDWPNHRKLRMSQRRHKVVKS